MSLHIIGHYGIYYVAMVYAISYSKSYEALTHMDRHCKFAKNMTHEHKYVFVCSTKITSI